MLQSTAGKHNVCAQFAELRGQLFAAVQAQDRSLSRGFCTYVPSVLELAGGKQGVD